MKPSKVRQVLGTVLAGLVFLWVLRPGHLEGQPNTSDTRSYEIILAGKLYCSLKRPVILFFPGEVTSIRVHPGQKVAVGEVLATCRLSPEAIVSIQRRLSPPQIRDLEAKLLDTRKNLATIQDRLEGMKRLAKERLVSDQSLAQTQREKQLLARQLSNLEEGLAKERQVAEADLQLLQKQLGKTLKAGEVPKEVLLLAPISGYILSMHPELREGVELKANEVIFQIGVMDPMIIRAKAHEIEAMQMAVGDKAEVTLEALPTHKFPAKISRLSWSPATLALEQPSYYEVEFTVPNPDLTLKEGLKARIIFTKSTHVQ